MNIKNIVVGQLIVAQDVHGGDINEHLVSTVLTVGKAYEVVAIDPTDEYPEQPIAINVPNGNPKFWVDPRAFTALSDVVGDSHG